MLTKYETEAVKGIMEDFDGEVVISDKRNFKNAREFKEAAEKYLKDTRGFEVSVLEPTTFDVVYNDETNSDECWMEKKGALQYGFEGITIACYRADIDWESVQ